MLTPFFKLSVVQIIEWLSEQRVSLQMKMQPGNPVENIPDRWLFSLTNWQGEDIDFLVEETTVIAGEYLESRARIIARNLSPNQRRLLIKLLHDLADAYPEAGPEIYAWFMEQFSETKRGAPSLSKRADLEEVQDKVQKYLAYRQKGYKAEVAAQMVGVPLRTLSRWVKQLGLSKKDWV